MKEIARATLDKNLKNTILQHLIPYNPGLKFKNPGKKLVAIYQLTN